MRELTLMEREVLNASGVIAKYCGQCEKPTYWTYVKSARRPRGHPPFPDVAPPPRVDRVKKFVNTRAHKRLRLYFPLLVRDQRGHEEISTTENISVGGLGVVLAMDLAVDEIVTYICPYISDSQNLEPQAACRWSAPASPGGTQKFYGFRCLQ
jgi:hypothetical protein